MAKATRNIPPFTTGGRRFFFERTPFTIGRRPIRFEPMSPLELLAEEWQRQQRVGRSPQKKRRAVQSYQGSRVAIKLAQLFSGGIPSARELADSELVELVRKAFEKDPKKTGLAIPHSKTILREAGRIPRKK